MPDRLDVEVKKLVDRAAIWDCLMNYCKGMDECDRALVLSAYHEDAYDDHGPYRGDARGLVDFAFDYHRTTMRRCVHSIMNHRIELHAVHADVESTFLFCADRLDGKGTMIVGRYADRFENRAGRWAIAKRTCTSDLVYELPGAVPPQLYANSFRAAGTADRGAGND